MTTTKNTVADGFGLLGLAIRLSAEAAREGIMVSRRIKKMRAYCKRFGENVEHFDVMLAMTEVK